MAVSNTIQKRRLGRTDIEVTSIGLGVMQFSGGGGMTGMMFPRIPQEEKNAIIKAALEGGINWFDTAEMYGGGNSEQGLARALKAAGKEDGDVIIATKWFPIFRTAGNIRKTIGDRIKHLNGYTIDLYMVHQPWGFSSPEAEMDAMADLFEQGMIRSVGVSNFSEDRMRRAHAALEKRGLTLAVNQVQYSLLNRKIETNGILSAAKELGVTIVCWSPLARGVLSGKYHQDPGLIKEKRFVWRMMVGRKLNGSADLVYGLREIAQKYGATPAQVALNWLINYHGDIVLAIPGASKASQAEESTGAMRFKLTGDEMTQLDILSRDFR